MLRLGVVAGGGRCGGAAGGRGGCDCCPDMRSTSRPLPIHGGTRALIRTRRAVLVNPAMATNPRDDGERARYSLARRRRPWQHRHTIPSPTTPTRVRRSLTLRWPAGHGAPRRRARPAGGGPRDGDGRCGRGHERGRATGWAPLGRRPVLRDRVFHHRRVGSAVLGGRGLCRSRRRAGPVNADVDGKTRPWPISARNRPAGATR